MDVVKKVLIGIHVCILSGYIAVLSIVSTATFKMFLQRNTS